MGSDEHLGVAEVAARLGVSRQRLHVLRRTYEDFPEPVARLARGEIWHGKDVTRWLKRHPQRDGTVRITRRGAAGS